MTWTFNIDSSTPAKADPMSLASLLGEDPTDDAQPTAATPQPLQITPTKAPTAIEGLRQRLRSRRWRIDNLYWILDETGAEIHFKMRFAQRLLYLGLWYMNMILKSRQHGITTEVCILYLDQCLFNSNTSAAIIAHNKEDAEAFFERNIRYAYDHLPGDLKAAVPATIDSARRIKFANGSSLRVTTSGRSGTFQLVHISELGKISAQYPAKAREIMTGTLNAVHQGSIVTVESTAEGREGVFYEQCMKAMQLKDRKAKLTRLDWKFFFFSWYQNPLNRLDPAHVIIYPYQRDYFEELRTKHYIRLDDWQKAWYVKKQETQGEDMKREHPSTPQEAFEASIMGQYYTRQIKDIRQAGRWTYVPYQQGALVDTWWDLGIGEGDTMAIWFTQDIGRSINVIDYYENSGEGIHFYKHDVLDAKARNKKYIYGRHGAPHDIANRELFLKGKTRLEAAKALGIAFIKAPKLSKASGIEMVRQIMPLCWFDAANTTMKYMDKSVGFESLEFYKKKWDKELGVYQNHPLHDYCSNGADAFRTMAVLHPFNRQRLLATPEGQRLAQQNPNMFGGYV